jgi:hypothetical protein
MLRHVLLIFVDMLIVYTFTDAVDDDKNRELEKGATGAGKRVL